MNTVRIEGLEAARQEQGHFRSRASVIYHTMARAEQGNHSYTQGGELHYARLSREQEDVNDTQVLEFFAAVDCSMVCIASFDVNKYGLFNVNVTRAEETTSLDPFFDYDPDLLLDNVTDVLEQLREAPRDIKSLIPRL